jgi:hypothetical protein
MAITQIGYGKIDPFDVIWAGRFNQAEYLIQFATQSDRKIIHFLESRR